MKTIIQGLVIAIVSMHLIACSSAPITTDEVQSMSYDCTNVDAKIAQLEKEKEENNKRILNGVRSVLPVSALMSMFKGRYKENVKIASGEWAEILDKEIADMQAFKKQCS